jgi:hypothetical protein
MKRFLTLPVSAALLVLASTVAYADPLPAGAPCQPTPNGNGAATCTVNIHPLILVLPASTCLPVPITISGNAIGHVTQNGAGDFWITETIEGSFVSTPAGYTGHTAQWFGFEQNSSNFVVHAIAEVVGTDPLGNPFRTNEAFHFSVSASGQGPVIFDKCSTN